MSLKRLYWPTNKLFKLSSKELDGLPSNSIQPQWTDVYALLEQAQADGLLNLGGGNGTSISYQDAGNGIIVKKSGSGNITTTKSVGLVTITVPDDTILESASILTSSADYNSGELSVRIVGGSGSGSVYNTSENNTIFPSVELENRVVLLETQPYASVDKDPADSTDIRYVRPTVSI